MSRDAKRPTTRYLWRSVSRAKVILSICSHATARYCYFVNVRVVVSLTFPFSLRSQFVTVNGIEGGGKRAVISFFFSAAWIVYHCRDTTLSRTLFIENEVSRGASKFRKEIEHSAGGGVSIQLTYLNARQQRHDSFISRRRYRPSTTPFTRREEKVPPCMYHRDSDKALQLTLRALCARGG